MRKLLFLILTLTCCKAIQAQTVVNVPQRVTPAIAKQINAEIEKEIPLLTKKYKEADAGVMDEEIAFKIDTFRIERFLERSIDYDYSTSGMNKAGYNAAEKYDSLLNKYYQLLLGKLDKEDKIALVEAQRAWLAFRDKELRLASILRKEKYSGGGTIQSTLYTAEHVAIIKERTLTLYHNYLDIITGY
jgi:uncharacterized protein YecT (DUF1311 family)